MHSIQLFIKVEAAKSQGQSYLNSPKFIQVTTSCEFNLVQALENILGGDLIYYEIVGPGPWVTWTSLAKELKGQQLSLVYHEEPVPNTIAAVYGPVKDNTDLKQPVSLQRLPSKINFVQADETHLKVFNITETINLEMPSDFSNSTTDSNKSTVDSSESDGREMQSSLIEGNINTVYSSFGNQDSLFTLDSQTQVKMPVVCKSNFPEYTQVVKIRPNQFQSSEIYSMNAFPGVNIQQNPLKTLNDVPYLSALEQNSSKTLSNNQISTQQKNGTLINQQTALQSIQKSSFQNTDFSDLQDDSQKKQNNFNNLNYETLTLSSHSLFAQNSLNSQDIPKIVDSESAHSMIVTRSSRLLSLEDNAMNSVTEVDDLSKKLSELPDVHLDISNTGSASASLFIQQQNMQQIDVTACSPSTDYVPHTCIQSVHRQQHNVNVMSGLSDCHKVGSFETSPPKRHRFSHATPLTGLLQQQHQQQQEQLQHQEQQQQQQQQIYHQTLLGKLTQRPNQLQLQQQASQQFSASRVEIQLQQQMSTQFTTSSPGKEQQQKSPPQFTSSRVDIQQLQKQMSPQFSASRVEMQQLQHISTQFTTLSTGKEQQQQMSQQFTGSKVDIQQPHQQMSQQFTGSKVDIHQPQQQMSPKFTSSRVGIQQLQQQSSAQFTASSISIQPLQQASPQFTISRVDMPQQTSQQFTTSSIGKQHSEHQISQLMTASAVGLQQKTSPTYATLNPDIKSTIPHQNSVSNLGWNLNQKNIDKIQLQQPNSQSKAELLNQPYLTCQIPRFSFPNTEELPNVSSNIQQKQTTVSSNSNIQEKQTAGSSNSNNQQIQMAGSSNSNNQQIQMAASSNSNIQQIQTAGSSNSNIQQMQMMQCKTTVALKIPEKQTIQQKYETVKIFAGSGQYTALLQPPTTSLKNPGFSSPPGRSLLMVSTGQPTSSLLPTFEFTVRLPHPEIKTKLNDPRVFTNTENPLPHTVGYNGSSTSLTSGVRFIKNEQNVVLGNEQGSRSPSQVVPSSTMCKDVKVSASQVQRPNGSSRSKKEDLSEVIATDEEGYNVIDNSDVPKGHLAGTKWQSPATPKRSGFNLERELLHIEGWNPQENGDTIQKTMEKYRSQDGSFILWKSRRHNKFIITVSHLNELLYFRVEETKNENQNRTVYYLFEGGFRSESLLDLVQHYRQNGLRIPMQYSGGEKTNIEHIRLRYPIKPEAKRESTTTTKPR